MDRILTLIHPIATPIGRGILNGTKWFGQWLLFSHDVVRWMFRPPWRWQLLIKHCEFVGVQSTAIIILTGAFVGMVFSLQTGKAFALFNAENLVGATLGLTLTREVGPVFTSLMIVARVCSSMAAEIGSMRVTEQIDALETMAVNPIHYLIVPRVIATTLMVPLLTGLFNVIGVIGGHLVATGTLNVDSAEFLGRLYHYVRVADLFGGLIKSACFGFLIALISCYCGYCARGGAKGVGRATTQAVVISSVTILVVDYFLTAWILEFISKPLV
jgi:phospholipid/cholesterol/gamma-HCH transport system permease protein